MYEAPHAHHVHTNTRFWLRTASGVTHGERSGYATTRSTVRSAVAVRLTSAALPTAREAVKATRPLARKTSTKVTSTNMRISRLVSVASSGRLSLRSPHATGTALTEVEAFTGVYDTVQSRPPMRSPMVAATLGSSKVTTTSLVRATPVPSPSCFSTPFSSVRPDAS
eukprot:scaffold74197_cov63-Phaeocystis_antarctica.AAC.2